MSDRKPGENRYGEQMFNADQRDAMGWNDKPERDGKPTCNACDDSGESHDPQEGRFVPGTDPPGPRFGARVLLLRTHHPQSLAAWAPELRALAAEVDADAEHEREHTSRYLEWFQAHAARADRAEADVKLLRAQLAAREREADILSRRTIELERHDLRQRIEAAVEALAYPELPDGEGDGRRVIWEAKLRESIDEVFGERPAAAPGSLPLLVIRPSVLRDAVNAACSCGGGEPGACCPACDVWHAVRRVIPPDVFRPAATADGCTVAGLVTHQHPRPDPLTAVRDALTAYHRALDRHEHGGVAAGAALDAIQEALGMPWRQGATL